MFGAQEFTTAGASLARSDFNSTRGPTIVVNQNFGVGTSPVEAGRAVEEVLFRFQQAGGSLRVTRSDNGVITLGV